MEMIYNGWSNIVQYVRNDWRSNRVRFLCEVFAWACSVISSVIFAITVPDIPVVPLYGVFISGCVAAGWAAYSRRSFGLLANYLFLVTIDCAGLIKMLLLHS